MAITWRNVDGGQGALAAGRLMQGAEQSFNSGFSGLQDALKQYQGQEKANWDAGKEQNTQAFLDRLSQARTPEEMASLQASGELDQMRAGFGAQIDRTATRNALDTRGDFLRQQATNRMTYDNTAQDHRDAPILNGFLAEARQIDIGDPKQVEAQLNQMEQRLSQSGLSERGQANAAQGLVDIRKSLLGDFQTTNSISNDNSRLSNQLRESNQRMSIAQTNQDYLLQGRAASALASKALEGAPDLATARDNYLQSSQDLPAELRDKGLGQLAQLYTKATGITPEQEAAIQKELSPYDADIAMAKEYVSSKPVFAQAEQDKVTEGTAISEAVKRTPGDEKDTADNIRKKVAEFRKNRKLGDDANLGAVVQESLRRIGTYDPWGPGEVSLDTGKLSDIMDEVYNDFVTYQGYQERLRTAESARASKQKELQGTLNIRNALKRPPPK